MDPELLKAYPLFGGLVSSINDKLSNKKASPKVQKAFEQAQRNLNKARLKWLRNKILHNELHEVLTDLEIQDRENTLSNDEKKLKDVLSKTLAHAELPDYLILSNTTSAESTLFGVTIEDVERHNPVHTHLPDLLKVVIPTVEEKLKQKCEDLYLYFDPPHGQTPSSENVLSAKTNSLPELVEKKKVLLAREKEHVREIQEKRDKQFWSYFQKLLECLFIMETLMRDFKCGSQAHTDEVTVHHLRAQCHASCLKVRSLRLKILCDTYTAETGKALRIVSEHLDTATNQAKRELSATSQSLHAFRRLGPEFTALAAEVTQLQQALQNKKWGLQQFCPDPSKVEDAGSEPVLMQLGASGPDKSTASVVTVAKVGNPITVSSNFNHVKPSILQSSGDSNPTERLRDTIHSVTSSDPSITSNTTGSLSVDHSSYEWQQDKLQQGKKVTFFDK